MENSMKPTTLATSLALAFASGCSNSNAPIVPPPPPPPTPPPATFALFETLGDSLSIAAKLTEFRTALGGGLNAPNSPPADSGRREINWDGVPAALTDIDTFPANFFNVNSKRGALYSTPGSGLRIDSTDFAAVNAGLAAQFRTFSAKKLFMPVGSNQVDVTFRLVGTNTPGLVKGFGAVFADVDRPASATIEYFDVDSQRIPIASAPNHAGAQLLSFTGNAGGSHSIQLTGIPPAVFRNSVVMSAAGSTYSLRIFHPGTYDYDCAVHGAAMTGRIVVK